MVVCGESFFRRKKEITKGDIGGKEAKSHLLYYRRSSVVFLGDGKYLSIGEDGVKDIVEFSVAFDDPSVDFCCEYSRTRKR